MTDLESLSKIELAESLHFSEIFDINNIQKIQDQFSLVTGIASIITTPDGTPITKKSRFCRLCENIRNTEKGKRDCLLTNKLLGQYNPEGPVIQMCETLNLLHAGTRITMENQHIANWVIGQVKDEQSPETDVEDYIESLGLDINPSLQEYKQIKKMTYDKFYDIATLLFEIAHELSQTAFQNINQKRLISSLKTSEISLLKNKEEINSIFRAAPTGIGVVQNRKLIKVNEKICELTGYSKDELLGNSARILYPNDDEFNFVGKEKYRQIAEQGTGRVETKFLSKNGEIKDILLSSTPLNINDLSEGVTFTALDISYLKNKEKELFESKERYQAMMNAIEDPTYICSSGYKIEYMNPSMRKIIGKEALGKTCYTAIFGTDSICPWCKFEQLSHEKALMYEVQNPQNNKIYHISCSQLNHHDKKPSMVSIFRDMTEIRLLEKNLQQAQKMEAIGTLAGGIAHDFNNILSPIIGYVELALEGLSPDCRETKYLQEVLKAGGRAKDLVQQILSFSRNNEFKQKPLYPRTIIAEALKLIRASLPSTIEIDQNIKANNSLIIADPSHIHQIIMNLCTNAFHAMEKSGGILCVRLNETKLDSKKAQILGISSGDYLQLSVSDTGKGIDKKIINRIFDPYFSTKAKEKGTGLGLSTTFNLVKEYSGAIEVFSEVNKGTDFILYFPIVQEQPEIISPKMNNALKYGNESILLVDDDKSIAEMEKEMLEMLGYSVTTCSHSINALELFRRKPDHFDLVISDLTMPHLTGDKLAQEIKAINRNIPVVLCTGVNDIDIKTENATKPLGIDAILKKPVSVINLSHEIRKILEI